MENPGKPASGDREAKLAEALRANLRRRKKGARIAPAPKQPDTDKRS
jgi:hypothetical protein